MIWWDCRCCTHKDVVMPFLWCSLTYVPFFVFFPPFFASFQHIISLSSTHLFLFLCLSFFTFFLLCHWPPSFWPGRASLLVSWLPCPSGQPWRRPTGPLPCLTPACSSTNRPWPTCSFSNRPLSSHQVWLPSDCPADARIGLTWLWLGLGRVVDVLDRFDHLLGNLQQY